jgi:tetratricopeptide (TPR) repeat protein
VVYYVTGNIELLGGAPVGTPNLGVHYLVQRCEAGAPPIDLVPQQDMTFPADQAVDYLNEMANFIQFKISNEIPRLGVRINPCRVEAATSQPSPIPLRLASSLTGAIVTSVNGSPGLIVDERADHVVDCVLVLNKGKRVLFKPGTEKLEVSIEVRTKAASEPYRAPDHPPTSLHDLESPQVADNLVRQGAGLALDTLKFVLTAERLNLQGQLNQLQAVTFKEKGRALLCPDEACELPSKDPSGALDALENAAKLDPGNPEILRYLGQAQYEASQFDQSRATLDKALQSLRKQEKATPLEAVILYFLGLSELQSGSPESAADHFQRLMTLYRQPPAQPSRELKLYPSYSLALRKSHQTAQAVQLMLEGLKRFPHAKDLHAQTRDLVDSLSLEELESVKIDGCGEGAHDECALINVERAARTYQSRGTLPDGLSAVNASAKAALDFDPKDTNILAEALAYAGIASLTVSPKEADNYFHRLSALPSEKLSPEMSDWTLRLQMLYARYKNDLGAAYSLAVRAQSSKTSSKLTLLVASRVAMAEGELFMQAARRDEGSSRLREARQWVLPLVEARQEGADSVLAEINHYLAEENETIAVLEPILGKNPADESAGRTLLSVCTDNLGDLACSLRVAKKIAESGFGRRSFGIQLDMIEVAILDSDAASAEEWITEFDKGTSASGAAQELPLRFKAVRNLYAFWLGVYRKSPDLPAKFDAWRAAMEELRQKNESIEWTFEGAKGVLKGKNDPDSRLLEQMIMSIENKSTPVPSFVRG